MKVNKEPFGKKDGKAVYSYTLVNDHGVEIHCLNFGCIITKIIVPDRSGNFENVVLGYDSLQEYEKDTYYLGAAIGRVAGRIAAGEFELNGKLHTISKNENNNHLHGGHKGFNQAVWEAEEFENEQEAGVVFTHVSPDGEEGYPGTLHVKITYTLNNENEFSIRYSGQSDQDTLVTLTNHSYFNLSGNLKRDILQHSLRIKSEQFLELDEELLPTGTLLDVKGTAFDFLNERKIEDGTVSDHPQNRMAGSGYDHPFLLKSNHDKEIVLSDSVSGRILTIETDEPAVIVYSGTQIKEVGEVGKVPASKYLGICLETQGVPGAIHYPAFPSYVLKKDEEYRSETTYTFGTVEN